jgi:uncharacterized protein DUF5989
MSKLGTVREFARFLAREKKWWLFPLIAILLVMAGLILFVQASSLAPFLYPFF